MTSKLKENQVIVDSCMPILPCETCQLFNRLSLEIIPRETKLERLKPFSYDGGLKVSKEK